MHFESIVGRRFTELEAVAHSCRKWEAIVKRLREHNQWWNDIEISDFRADTCACCEFFRKIDPSRRCPLAPSATPDCEGHCTQVWYEFGDAYTSNDRQMMLIAAQAIASVLRSAEEKLTPKGSGTGKRLTLDDVVSLGLGWTRSYVGRLFKEHYSLPLVDILNATGFPSRDRLWIALQSGVLPGGGTRMKLACDFAKLALPAWESHSSHNMCPHHLIQVGYKWINGAATGEELTSARRDLLFVPWGSRGEGQFAHYAASSAYHASKGDAHLAAESAVRAIAGMESVPEDVIWDRFLAMVRKEICGEEDNKKASSPVEIPVASDTPLVPHTSSEDQLERLLQAGVLPEHVRLGLACSFAEEALCAWKNRFPHDVHPRHLISVKRRWLKGEATDEELLAVQNALLRIPWGGREKMGSFLAASAAYQASKGSVLAAAEHAVQAIAKEKGVPESIVWDHFLTKTMNEVSRLKDGGKDGKVELREFAEACQKFWMSPEADRLKESHKHPGRYLLCLLRDEVGLLEDIFKKNPIPSGNLSAEDSLYRVAFLAMAMWKQVVLQKTSYLSKDVISLRLHEGCYVPMRVCNLLSSHKSLSLLEVLNMKGLTPRERLWIVLHEKVLPKEVLRSLSLRLAMLLDDCLKSQHPGAKRWSATLLWDKLDLSCLWDTLAATIWEVFHEDPCFTPDKVWERCLEETVEVLKAL